MSGRVVFLLEEPSMKAFLQEFLPRLVPGWQPEMLPAAWGGCYQPIPIASDQRVFGRSLQGCGAWLTPPEENRHDPQTLA
jgi:hypothetical protein